MLDTQDIYHIAKSYRAEITAGKQIQWHDTESSLGQWKEMSQYPPSVMDSVILDRSYYIKNYFAAAQAATGWTDPMVRGFQQAMLIGRPLETEVMKIEDFKYWKGMVIGLMVIQKLKSRLWEAEGLFA